jgi:hypothetical protein
VSIGIYDLVKGKKEEPENMYKWSEIIIGHEPDDPPLIYSIYCCPAGMTRIFSGTLQECNEWITTHIITE